MPFVEPDAQFAGPIDGHSHAPRFDAAIWPETSEVQQHIGHDGPCARLSLEEHNDVSYVDKNLSSTIPSRAGDRGRADRVGRARVGSVLAFEILDATLGLARFRGTESLLHGVPELALARFHQRISDRMCKRKSPAFPADPQKTQ